MKKETIALASVMIAILAVAFVDWLYVSRLEKKFVLIEKERIVISNKLATAKIVYENLNHVHDLVFKNMDFPGRMDTVAQETRFFDYVTTCINDLKLKLVSVEPVRPVIQDRITTFGYTIVIEGDFFKFGELCSKFENSRRIISLETFNVDLISSEKTKGLQTNKGIRVKMRVNTYRVKKV
jgi:hypothetical protein